MNTPSPRPNFTDWLRDLEPPETGWRPSALVGAVCMIGTGELMDWVGQGYGGVNTTALLDAVELSCSERNYDPATVYIIAHKRDRAPHPFEVRNNHAWAFSAHEDTITIYFPPVREGI
ncbi:hypothetical protein SAMN03159338_1495 [Sphingomonas sp. NFR04]|uniref:hypothetical protein n=1 Tax=Sphingomonas sp. NFR04 TaxID=1566283 RepID=UPI0008F256DB|nr:hypothetical protein [Sphingomonas sp. NFR04]SFJ47530.1 hypothetical protein SAMN03159338_1495 [Sphingomonas sp. NFR04]